jgi:signal transduction histidine kinase
MLDFLVKQSKRVPVPVLLVAVVQAWIAAGHITTILCVAWGALVGLTLLLRTVCLNHLSARDDLAIETRLRLATALSGLSGTVHALSLWIFPELTDFEQATQSLILAGLCTGAIATTAGYRAVYIAYFIPVFVPLTLLWLTDAEAAWPPTRENVPISLTIVAFGAVLIVIAGDTSRSFVESVEIRFEHVALNNRLQQALSDDEAANHAKTRFLDAASHDLRQPIHALSLFTGALTLQKLEGRASEIAKHINQALGSIAVAMDEMLDLSKLDSGGMQCTTQPVDVGPLVSAAAAEFANTAESKGLVLNTHLLVQPFVESDPVHLQRVIRNLLANAIRYTEDGEVSVSVAADGGVVSISIKDTGPGIDDDQRKHIFDEFYQVQEGSREGLGLCLSIVARLISLLDINESRLDAGGGQYFQSPYDGDHRGRTTHRADVARCTRVGVNDHRCGR